MHSTEVQAKPLFSWKALGWALLYFWFFSTLLQAIIYISGYSGTNGIRDSLLFSSLWLIPVFLFPKRIKIIAAVIGVVLWAASLAALCYYVIYGQEFSQSVLFVMFETNTNEASEYLSQYFSLKIVLIALAYTAVAVLLWTRLRPVYIPKPWRYVVSFALLYGLILHPIAMNTFIKNKPFELTVGVPRSAIEGILQANPDNVVIVDEAYVDFGGESCVPLIDRYENLLVVQTFSKSRQLAGARLGLAMGNAKLIADLNRVKFSLNPYNINRLTLKAGQAALEDTVYFEKTRAAIVDTRAWTKQQLEARGFAVLDSRSNFLFASTQKKNGGELYRKLKEKGVLVRHFDAPRIENWLRITIGTPEQMQIFLNTLDKIMEE